MPRKQRKTIPQSLVTKRRAPRTRPAAMSLYRDPNDPFGRHLSPDFERPANFELEMSRSARLRRLYEQLPQPLQTAPQWNSVALFFNLPVNAARPSAYRDTTVADARQFLDEGTDPATTPISAFLLNYWSTLSYGMLAFGLDTPRDANGDPIVATVQSASNNPMDWEGLIKECVKANPDAIWNAAGSLMNNGKRWIPSVVLVQNYAGHPSAWYGGMDLTVGGIVYTIGDLTHVDYDIAFVDFVGPKCGRRFWSVLCHEYGHNFLEFPDLYGPAGCTGYWDLNGESTPPGRMSEVCSAIKARAGWISFKQVITGPIYAATDFELQPYTTTGEALKVVPDPQYTPQEYFLLEYRKSTGSEVWRPDGALPEDGLLIIHINERLGVSDRWLMHDAPFFDPEFADFSDHGGAAWTGHGRLTGVLFRQGTNMSFGPTTQPASHFYGGRPSGLSISQIRVESGLCKFRLGIEGNPRVGWTVGARDRCIAGRFTTSSLADGMELFCRNDQAAALFVHREAQWFVAWTQSQQVGAWPLRAEDQQLAADLDGDGRAEIYVRAPGSAGVLRWRVNEFRSIAVHTGSIGAWSLADSSRDVAADLDGDGKDEIVSLRGDRMAVLKLGPGGLELLWLGPAPVRFAPTSSLQVARGRFRQRNRDEILAVSGGKVVLLAWSPEQQRLVVEVLVASPAPVFPRSATVTCVAGDFDGDGFGEIYARYGHTAALLKWVGRRFRVLWQEHISVSPVNQGTPAVSLRASDRSYTGRFMPDRDGILHRADSFLAVFTWEGRQFLVRHHKASPFKGMWPLSTADRFVIGDFHRKGPNLGDPQYDTVVDGIADVFIHNASGTAMMGVNHGAWNPANPNDIISEMGLTWIAWEHLLFDR